MVTFTTTIQQFDEQGEKTGWTYIEVPAAIAEQLMPNHKKGFRVKGKLDTYAFSGIALLPMGEGNFIMALKADIRKVIKKRKGDTLKVQLAVDEKPYELCAELVECLNDEPRAIQFFNTLPRGHQNYFSKWIESAKTVETKSKRIAQAVSALAKQMGYSEMIRFQKEQKEQLGDF